MDIYVIMLFILNFSKRELPSYLAWRMGILLERVIDVDVTFETSSVLNNIIIIIYNNI